MDKNNRSYRVHTEVNPGQNTVLNVKLDQDIDFLDVLSLSINQENLYKFHMANYGCVIGRVVANGGLGVPNAKISVFIKVTDETSSDVIKNILYPYSSPSTKNMDGIKYNNLLDEQINDCYQAVGTFKPKRMVLDNNTVLDIFDEYWKYSTVSNDAGDYMLFGLPLNNNTIHVDLDLSDCGFLSQKPRDMFYKGYNIEQFDSPVQFKKDTNLDNLSQIWRQDSSAFVYPFWGDEEEGEIGITRYDIDIAYKFESTCIFMGSVITDGEDAVILKTCSPQKNMGNMGSIVSRQGKIEMLRKSFDGIIETFQIKGDALIDGDGVWCYQIPMNMDYVINDEYGNLIPTDNPNKGIATRAEVRFRFTIEEGKGSGRKRAQYLVPMNPDIDPEKGIYNMDEVDYEFNENTKDESFVNLFWNKVYSVKSYIPRTQIDKGYKTRKFTGIKNTSYFGNNNPFPFNTLYINLPFSFVLICIVGQFVIKIVAFLNNLFKFLTCMSCGLPWPLNAVDPCHLIGKLFCGAFDFIELGTGFCPTMNAIVLPAGCGCDNAHKDFQRPGCLREKWQKNNPGESPLCNEDEIMDCMISALAEEYEVVNYDFTNDWINGCLYFPTFHYRDVKKTRRKWLGLFGPKKVTRKREFCGVINEDERAADHKTWFKAGVSSNSIFQNCAVAYKINATGDGFDYDMDYEANKKATSIINDLSQEDLVAAGAAAILTGGVSAGVEAVKSIFDRNTCNVDYCYKQKLRVQFASGIVNLFTDKNENEHFYYRPYHIDKRFRLYTTDLILLGSLNDCDLDGIFQLHQYLPPSSYNLPSMAKEIYVIEDEDEDGNIKINEGGGGNSTESENDEDRYKNFSGPLSATGANWGKGQGRNNVDQRLGENNYHYDRRSAGLFVGIGCTDSHTTNKSCVNVKRICEVGVDLDYSFEKYYSCEQLIKEGKIEGEEPLPIVADGFISKDEIIDGLEVRQMFATLNSHRLTYKNIVEKYGYKTYWFEYLYPENFDGKMGNEGTFNYKWAASNSPVTRVKSKSGIWSDITGEGAPDPQFKDRVNFKDEWFDKYYFQFRYGAPKIDPVYHFYDTKWLRGDRTINSFYFYFGITPGNTAIEQFWQKFWGTCVPPHGNDITVKITIINHAMICVCDTDSAPTVQFLMEVRQFNNSYSIEVTDEFGNVIELEPGTLAQEEDVETPEYLTWTELKFGEEDDKDIHFFSEEFKKGGIFNFIIMDESGKQFTTQANILIQGIVQFNADIAEQMMGGLQDSLCDGKKCPPEPNCTNDCECVCCGDYLKKPEDDNPNSLKARIQLKGFDSIIKKGCKLCDYELVVSRYVWIGEGLYIKITGDKDNGLTNVEITKYQNGGRGYQITPPPGTPELTYKDLMDVERPNPNDYINVPGGNGGLISITKVDKNGTVSMSPLGIEIIEPGTDYNNYDSVGIGPVRALMSRKIYDLGGEAFWFNCEQKSCSDFEKDNDPNFGIDLYVCGGEYDITIRNKKKDEECKYDAHTETISITEPEPLCLTMNGGEIYACKIQTYGEDRFEKDCWWYWFFLYLNNDNYKFEIDNKKKPADGLPDNVPSPCPANPEGSSGQNTNWMKAPEEQGIMFWYADPNIRSDEESVKEWKEKLRNTFMVRCGTSAGIVLGGKGYLAPYTTVLFGANHPSKGGPDPDDPALAACDDCDEVKGQASDANDSASKFVAIGINSAAVNGETLTVEPCDLLNPDGCQYAIAYKTVTKVFSGDVSSIDTICKIQSVEQQITPNGAVFTLSRIPVEHPCGVWKDYKEGGYYAGVMGMAGLGTGWPGGLGALMKEIRKDNGGGNCNPMEANQVVKLSQLWDKIISKGKIGDYDKGYLKAMDENLFYFHIFDKRMMILKNYLRVAGYHPDYAQPQIKDDNNIVGDGRECHTHTLSGYIDAYYQNGPEYELRETMTDVDYEFVIKGISNVGIDHEYHLSTDKTTLPSIRHFYSTETSNLTEDANIILEEYLITRDKDGKTVSSTLTCSTEIALPFGMQLKSSYITVTPHVQCVIDEARLNDPYPPIKVANSYCYDLNISGIPTERIGLGCFEFFKMEYKAKTPAFGYGAKIMFSTSRLSNYSLKDFFGTVIIRIADRGRGYQKDDIIYAYPPGKGSPAVFRVTNVDPVTGGITNFTLMDAGSGFKCQNPSGAMGVCIFNAYPLYPSPIPITDELPENLLYFPYANEWTGDTGHFNRPFFTYDVINDLHLNEPGPAPNQDKLVDQNCADNAQWVAKYIIDLTHRDDPKYNIKSVNTELDPWMRVGDEWQENVDELSGVNYNKFLCGILPMDGSGMITNNTDEIYYTIVHDRFSQMRAFSQPIDLGNYLRVVQIECDPESFSNRKNYPPDAGQDGSDPTNGDTFGGSIMNTQYEIGEASGACMLTMSIEVVGRNSLRCYGYTWKIQQGEYEYREDEPKASEAGWENYYGKDNNVLFTNDKYENSQNCWIKFKPEIEYVYEKIRSIAKDGLDPQIYSNENNGVLEAVQLELDIKDRKKLVRISMVDASGAEFYMYTSVFRWIDTCQYLTYCVYDCNEGDFPLAVKPNGPGDWGIVVDFEIIGDLPSGNCGSWLYKDVQEGEGSINNGAGWYKMEGKTQNQENNITDFPKYGWIAKTPSGGSPILQQGKNWIKVGQALSDGTILEAEYRGKLYFGYGSDYVELDQVVVSNCNFLYKAQIKLC
jgi:hypothetical protein